MRWDQIRAEWSQVQSEARRRWPELSDTDIARIAGERDELVARLRHVCGYEPDEAERAADDFAESLEHTAGDDAKAERPQSTNPLGRGGLERT